MQLPVMQQVSKEQFDQTELSFKFMRYLIQVLRNLNVANRPVTMMDESFIRIEIANVTRDNCIKKVEACVKMIVSHSAGNNVFEFSRIAVAQPEDTQSQFTICFYGHWKTEKLEATNEL